MAPVTSAVTSPVTLGEGPHWDELENALYFVSIRDNEVHRYEPDTGKHTSSHLDAVTTFIIPIEGRKNHFAVGLGRKVVELVWDGEDDSAKVIRTIAEVDQDKPNNRLNDAKADPRGRLFAGTMGHEYEPDKFEVKKGSLFRIDPDGSVHKLIPDVDCSNGLCWDLKEKAFYYADSFEYVLRRYDYDVETGDISNPKILLKCSDHGIKGILDGMTIDTDGNLWIANYGGSQVLHIDPRTSKIIKKLAIPALQTTSATFGGVALDQLYVTSAALGSGQLPPCGAVFKVSALGVKGFKNVRAKFD